MNPNDTPQSLAELKSDIEEGRTLISSAFRKRWRDILTIELQKLEVEELKQRKDAQDKAAEVSLIKSSNEPKGPSITIRNYSWDQSDNFVKLYISLPSVHKINKDLITTSFKERCLNLYISDLEGKNYQLNITNLAYNINPSASSHKIKTDMVLVLIRKTSLNQWEAVTSSEKKTLDTKKADLEKSPSEKDDPSAGIMDLMKKMYSEGDDNMKRMLNKTWYESQNKQNTASMPGMPDMGMGGMGMGGMPDMGMGGMPGMPDMKNL